MAEAPCELDVDCPAALLCLIDGETTECGCHVWYGLATDPSSNSMECVEWGPNTYTIVLVAAAIALSSFLALGPAVYTMGRVFYHERLRALKQAPNSTLLLVTLGLFALMMGQITYALEAITPLRPGSTMVEHADGVRRSSIKPYTAVFNVVYQTLGFLACLNVSVMWLEVSQHARAMRMVTSQNVDRYRRVCFVVGVLFSIAMITCVALERTALAVVVAQPLLLPVGILFIVGRRRIVSVLEEAIVINTNRSQELSENAKRTIGLVNTCSLRVIVGIFALLAAGIVVLTVDVFYDTRRICRVDSLCISVLASAVAMTAMLGIYLSILFYSLVMVRRRLSGQTGSSMATNKSTSSMFSNRTTTEVPTHLASSEL